MTADDLIRVGIACLKLSGFVVLLCLISRYVEWRYGSFLEDYRADD